MASTGKRNRNVLSVEEKVTIISRLEKGETGVSLAKIFNVGKATISDIKSRKSEILKFASQLNSENGSKKRKTMKKASDEKLENAVYLWFLQQRSQGKPISGPLLCEKALQLNQKLEGPSEFKASTGWLKNFKSRHGIRELEFQEASSINVRAAEAFKESFLKMVEEEGFSKDDVYSADETCLNWKSLPGKSLALRREMAAPDFKAKKRCVTVMVCANASGQHALPLLVIGKSESPRCFKGVTCLPVRYKAQKYAWIDSNIFLDWFGQDFIPNVKRQRENNGKTGKVLLIIDSAPSHPSLEKLNSFDENFIVRFLPPNVTALLQPMGHGVIEKLKNMYKIQVLRRLLLPDDEESVVEFSKKLNIKDCCYMIADAWKMLSEGDLQRAWHKLWCAAEETAIHVQDVNEDIVEIVSLFHKIPGFSECGQDEAEAWLNNDLGYDILTEEEIVASVQDGERADIHQGDSDAEEEEAANRSTHMEAFRALETALAWCERQSECSSMDILLLKRMRDLAAKKKISHGSKKN